MIADDILALSDLRTGEVHVKEWDKTLQIQELGLSEALKLFSEVGGDGAALSGEQIASVVAAGVIDDKGNRVFDDKHVSKLAKKNRTAMLTIYQAIMALSEGDVKN